MNKSGLDKYVLVNNKKLRCGYTTGSCAAAASKAAAYMLLTQTRVESVGLDVPKGIHLDLLIEDISMTKQRVSCAVRKDGGDDYDVTHGALVYAQVEFNNLGQVRVLGGKGVGRVTLSGLACAVGEAAINPVPKRMIISEVEHVLREYGGDQGLDVIISVPEGESLAQKTFNSRLGIQGGISILGTSGIVEPMSEAAIIDTMRAEMDVRKARGVRDLLVFFGNYGEDFTRDVLRLSVDEAVICSNFVGEMLDYASYLEFDSVLLVGHAGKLVKLSLGVMNTHSKYADCRTEPLALYALFSGASQATAKQITECVTTVEAIRVLRDNGLEQVVFARLCERIDYYMQARVYSKLKTGAVIFLNDFGVLGKTVCAEELLNKQHTKRG